MDVTVKDTKCPSFIDFGIKKTLNFLEPGNNSIFIAHRYNCGANNSSFNIRKINLRLKWIKNTKT